MQIIKIVLSLSSVICMIAMVMSNSIFAAIGVVMFAAIRLTILLRARKKRNE